MKKLMSLLLALVLTLGLLTGLAMAADKPEECTEAEAAIKVTCEKDDNVYYFPELNDKVVDWATENLTTGMRTITFLKDIDSTNTKPASTGYLISLGGAQANWGTKNQGRLTFDLNGHSWTYVGERSMLNCKRWGCFLKNGTINYTHTLEGSVDHMIFDTGSSSAEVAISGKPYDPKFGVDNCTINDLTTVSNTHTTFRTFNYAAEYSITNSTVNITKGFLMHFYRGTQKTAKAEHFYENDFASVLNIKNCTINTGEGAVLRTSKDVSDAAKANIEDTLVIGKVKGSTCNAFVTEADSTTENYNGTTATAYVFGSAPGLKIDLPFTDVKEGDWFYDFVAQMYSKKIINGMTETTFVPNGTLTYGQALKLIAVGLDMPEQPAGAHWASGYLLLAKENEWLTEDVDLNGPVTRLAFCQIAAKAKGLTEVGENPFKDTADASVLALVKAGVISGMSADTFAPDQTLTRAQIAKIISLLIKL